MLRDSTPPSAKGGTNRPNDVRTIQELLNQHLPKLGVAILTPSNVADQRTIAAIEDFQRRVMHLTPADGRVDHGGRTLQALQGAAAPIRAVNPASLSGAGSPERDSVIVREGVDRRRRRCSHFAFGR